MDLLKVGENIRVLRTLKKYSQETLGKKVGKSQNWQQQVEKGEIDISLTSLFALGEELEVSAAEILNFIPQTVFNNCVQSGNYNHYAINNEEFLNKIAEIVLKTQTKL